jgi:arylsulfatase
MLFGGASYWDDMFGLLAEHEEVAEYVLDDKRLEELPKDFYATRSYTDFLIDSIRENRDDGKPFLAYLAFTAPHDPMHVPEPWLSKYRGNYDDGYEVLKAKRAAAAKQLGLIPDSALMPERYHMVKAWDSLTKEQRALEARGMEVYAGMVNNMDYHFGRVVKFLKDIGEYDNTIVIFLSDNGPNPWYSEDYPGNKGSEWFAQFDNSIDNLGQPMSHYAYGMGWGSASAGPLDLFKMTVAEGGIRSPMLIAGPGVKGGLQVGAFAYVWDIMPTILEFAGIPHPEKYRDQQVESMRGKSLQGVLAGSTKLVYDADDFICGEMQDGKWVRQGDLKAVSVASPYGLDKWQLYDIAVDPGESNNLAQKQPEKLEKLIAAWSRYSDEVGVVGMK